MKRLGTTLGLAFWLLLASIASPSAAEDDTLLVIVNASASVSSLSADELAAIFGLSKRTWPSGASIAPFNYDSTNELRVRFDRAVLRMDPDEVAHYWIDRKIRGGGDAPRKVPNVAMMVRVVASLPNAIGYVPAGTSIAGTKVVARISKGKISQAGTK
jgi:ABC-type phosphate transport system substrate-binding protein